MECLNVALRSIRGFVKEDVVVEGSGADSHRPRTSGCWPSSAILLILHGHVETYFHTLSDMKDASVITKAVPATKFQYWRARGLVPQTI